MRFAWKVTLAALCILLLCTGVGSYLLISLSFQSALEREIDMAQEEMQMLRISFEAVCDARGVTKISPALTTTLAGLSQHIKVVPMGDEEDGTCIIETPEEIIDASVSTQMSTMRDLLSEQLGGQIWPPQ